ncbi:MAG: FAD-dependent oxidoreductase, partial [Peptococcaceae bacterium]|nr:FAD-dependent oxidoreductase [Peptococcaceae bacterium]
MTLPIEYIADEYEVIVVGAGHAGCEAALAAA